MVAFFFSLASIVITAVDGTPTNGLHQTVLTGSLWIVFAVVGLVGAPTMFDGAKAFLVKP